MLTSFLSFQLESDSDYEDYDSITSGNVAAPEYKRLIAIHAGNAKNKCLRQVLRVRLDRARRLSLSEQELERAATLYASDVVRYAYLVFCLCFLLRPSYDYSYLFPLLEHALGSHKSTC